MRAAARRLLGDPDVRVAVVLGVGTVVLLAATAGMGFVRDEGYYFRAAREYHAWFSELWRDPVTAFSDATLRRSFGYNTEHPGLLKLSMGLTWRLFHEVLGWTSHALGYRLGSMVYVGLGVAFLYMLGARLFSRAVGLLAVALLLVSPHVFFHSHLACFDAPIMGLTVVATYLFWRACEDRRFLPWCGLTFGLALASKHNAVFLLPTFALAVLCTDLRNFRRAGFTLKVPDVPMAFFWMVVLGPLVLVATYPFGWHDPVGRLGDYYRYHLNHEHYAVEYFGEVLAEPPFPIAYPFVMSALTIPLTILAPGLFGVAVVAVRAVRGSLRAEGRSERLGLWLVIVSILVPPSIIAVPSVPIFGGTKHWMTMMPFLTLLSAWVVVTAAQWLATLPKLGRGAALAAAVLVGLTLLLPALETARTHPYGQTYFNELAGGHQGAIRLGMMRTFWGGDGNELLPILNDEAPPGAAIYTHRMNLDSFQAYKRDGLLRQDLRWVGEVRLADWAFVHHQRGYGDAELEIWSQRRGDRRPRQSVVFDGVPMVSLYRLR